MRRKTISRYLAAVLVALLAGCATTALREAPVADRSARAAPPVAERSSPATPRQAAADGIYVVQPGDTLYSIAAAFGRDVKDLARWNNLDDPAKIRVGQSLRVAAPAAETAAVVPVTPAAPAQAKPLDAAPASSPPSAAAIAPAAPALEWLWPVSGRVIEKFDEKRNKGIDIAGKEGDPVLASGDGQVVYSGNGLRGYGNLVIVKHSDDFISAYAHNRQILVKQGDRVRRGQRIAEVGRSEASQPKLHFEIRWQGKPVDPLAYLPPR